MSDYITTKDDNPRIREIWDVCFDDTKEFSDWFFDNRYCEKQTLSLRENGKIVSNLQMIPYKINLRGAILDSWFIVGAATLPEARKKGYMATLLLESYRVMRDAGVTLSHLYPFQYDFYRQYGYDICSKRLLQRLSPSDILKSQGVNQTLENSKPVMTIKNNADASDLLGCYNDCLSKYDGYVKRDIHSMQRRLNEHKIEGGHGLIVMNGDKVCAYMLYAISEKKIISAEVVYNNQLDIIAMLVELAKRFIDYDTIEFSTPVEDEVTSFLKDGRQRAFLEPFDMLRIIDVCRLLESLSYDRSLSGEIVLCIQDDCAKWNDGNFAIALQNGKACVEKTKKDYDVKMGVSELMQVITSMIDSRRLKDANRASFKQNYDNLQLDQVFPAIKSYIYEMY